MFEKYLQKTQKQIKPKRSFLRIKKHWKGVVVLVLLVVIVVSGFLGYQSQFALSATWTWDQINWSGQASTDTSIHPTNQTGWNKYSSKDDSDGKNYKNLIK